MRKFIRERRELEKDLPNEKLKLRLTVDRAKFSQVTGIEEEEDTKIKQHISNKARKEDEEKLKREQERHDLMMYSNLANSLLEEKRLVKESRTEEESLVGPNRRRTTRFADQSQESLEMDGEEEVEHEEEGPRVHRIPLRLNLGQEN